MAGNLPTVEGQYLRDILAQPRALADTLAGLEDSASLRSLGAQIRKARFKTVVLTGMGSSFHALHPLHNQLIQLGLSALTVETSELVHYKGRLLDARNVVVAVSQSGRSVEMLRLLKMNRGKSPLIAVTNSEDSPLARNADAALLTRAGAEFSVSCKTYVTALMALQWLADVIGNRDLRRTRKDLSGAPGAVEDYLRAWKKHVKEFAELLKNVRNLFFVGRGNSLAAVGTGALIAKESAHFATEGLSSAAFRHGPFEMLNDETLVLVFGGDPKAQKLNQYLLKDIRACGGKAELIGPHSKCLPCALPTSDAAVRPILEILPIEMVTLSLAALGGREAGRFTFATKVTTKE